MTERSDIEKILAAARRNPADTTEFLLGKISNDVITIKENQAKVILDVEDLKKRMAWVKGFIACAGIIGGLAVKLWGMLFS